MKTPTQNRVKSGRKRRELDFYETPQELCVRALQVLRRDENRVNELYTVLDAGAGKGVWGNAYNKIVGLSGDVLFGVELQELQKPSGYDFWLSGQDYLDYKTEDDCFGLIFGNPPYSLAEEFIRHSMTLVADFGYIYFLLPLNFLGSKKRKDGLFSEYPPKRVYVSSRRPSFLTVKAGSRTTDARSYAMFLWQRGYTGKTELDWLYWEYDK